MKKAKDFITRDLTSVTEDTLLKEAAEIIAWRAFSGVPVVNNENEVTGYISERNILTAIFPEQVKVENPDVINIGSLTQVITKLRQVGDALVKDYMDKKPFLVKEDTPATDMANLMINNNIKRLPVVRNKKLIGVVDRANLSRILIEGGSLD